MTTQHSIFGLKRPLITLTALAALLAGLSGCETIQQEELNFGVAYHKQLEEQKLVKEVPPPTPVEDMDGNLAAKKYDEYRNPVTEDENTDKDPYVILEPSKKGGN